MELYHLHRRIASVLPRQDRFIYLLSLFFFYVHIFYMVSIVILKILDLLNLFSSPWVYAAPQLNWTFFETVLGWSYIALLVIGTNLHFKGMALLPKAYRTASLNRYVYYYEHGWTFIKKVWQHFQKFPEIKSVLIYIFLFLVLVYLYNTL